VGRGGSTVAIRCRLRVTFATHSCPEGLVRAVNLDYPDPAEVGLEAAAANGETFVVPEEGKVLFRLR
jgi:hypothetical protein